MEHGLYWLGQSRVRASISLAEVDCAGDFMWPARLLAPGLLRPARALPLPAPTRTSRHPMLRCSADRRCPTEPSETHPCKTSFAPFARSLETACVPSLPDHRGTC